MNFTCTVYTGKRQSNPLKKKRDIRMTAQSEMPFIHRTQPIVCCSCFRVVHAGLTDTLSCYVLTFYTLFSPSNYRGINNETVLHIWSCCHLSQIYMFFFSLLMYTKQMDSLLGLKNISLNFKKKQRSNRSLIP